MLKITHNCGFFSCCTVKMYQIISYFNNNKNLPSEIDGSMQFGLYKYDKNIDVTNFFFEDYNNNNIQIKYHKDIEHTLWGFQFNDYKSVNYELLTPFVKKYFTPSIQITDIVSNLISKYNIDINNCIGLYYRGTDKYRETILDNYETYYNKLIEIIENEPNKNIQILVQTDTTQFLDFIKEKNLKNIIVIEEISTSNTTNGIHYLKKPADNFNDMKNLMASFLIISKCKYIICSSGNCSIWMMYYRENANNVHQNLNKKWY